MKVSALALAAAVALAPWPDARAAPPAAPDPFPRAGRSYLVELDGGVIWAREPDLPRPPSTSSLPAAGSGVG